MIILTWLVLWIPFFIAAGILFFFLKRPKLAGVLATAAMFACFVLSCWITFHFFNGGAIPESSLPWITLPGVAIEFGVLVNGLSALMLLIVTGIGSLIFLYSTSYMKGEEGVSRYFASLSFFAFSMLGIVLSNNFIQMFIFWELVGLSSYFLIGFWFEKPAAATAGKKAFLTTRVGDVGMLIGILMLFGILAQNGHATFNFLELESIVGAGLKPAPTMMTAICLLIFLGVVGKSAQVPLHVWLPDAMEGPTPVSALIHAATMVAAGVFLLARLFFLFSASPDAMTVIAWTGAVTAFLAGTLAIVQNDIKKILAYSTLSQLGYMVMALGLASPEAGMFHLTTHAFFKALLFLGAGSLIHALHTQDIWEMGSAGKNLTSKMPVTALTFFMGTVALMGIWPTSGYFSKEEVLAAVLHAPRPMFYLAMATVFLTAFYMARLCLVVFFPAEKKESHAHESDWRITIPLILLGILSLAGGYLPIRDFLGESVAHREASNLPQIVGLLAGTGILLALIKYKTPVFPSLNVLFRIPEKVLLKKYFFDDLYDAFIRYVQENVARASDGFERHVVVEAGVNGLAGLMRYAGDLLRRLQTGLVQFYAAVFALGVTAMIYFMIIVGK